MCSQLTSGYKTVCSSAVWAAARLHNVPSDLNHCMRCRPCHLCNICMCPKPPTDTHKTSTAVCSCKAHSSSQSLVHASTAYLALDEVHIGPACVNACMTQLRSQRSRSKYTLFCWRALTDWMTSPRSKPSLTTSSTISVSMRGEVAMVSA